MRVFDLRIDERTPVQQMVPALAALTDGVLMPGNDVRVIRNGAFFDALLDDVAAATSSVHLENYLWKSGRICDRVIAALAAKARDGVAVRVIHDRLGARHTERHVFQPLRDAGCETVRHRPSLPLSLAAHNRRDHRKLAVIDGRIAYVFGHAVADEWAADDPGAGEWCDVAIRIEGPVVRKIQSEFIGLWALLSGRALVDPVYFPEPRHAGFVDAHVAAQFSTRKPPRSVIQRLYYSAIQLARRRLLIQSPYFVPDAEAVRHLCDAARRGVEVRVMCTAAARSDFPFVQHAGHGSLKPLLDAGVEVLEYCRAGLHQKVIVVDELWSCVGSANFDPRSFRLSAELSVGMLDAATAGYLAGVFTEDEAHCRAWTRDRWSGRGLQHRVVDGAAALVRAFV